MYSPLHATTGALLATVMPNPAAAVLAGIASHYILDAIPHGDSLTSGWLSSPRRIVRVESLDLGTAVFVSWWVIAHHPHSLAWSMALGAIGGVLPDMLWGARLVLDRLGWRIPLFLRGLRWHDKFHAWSHAKPNYDLSFKVGLIGQVILLVFLLQL